MKTIIINQHKESERFEAFCDAMMDGTEIEGGYVVQYVEQTEAGETIGKFTLREADGQE